MIPLICFDICKKTVLLMVSRYFPNNVPILLEQSFLLIVSRYFPNNVPILLEQSFQWFKIFSEQCPSPPRTIFMSICWLPVTQWWMSTWHRCFWFHYAASKIPSLLIPSTSWSQTALYSYKNDRNSQARTVALRTFIGSCCTLTSSVVWAH
jgi:hypothetical protein